MWTVTVEGPQGFFARHQINQVLVDLAVVGPVDFILGELRLPIQTLVDVEAKKGQDNAKS